jgi:hypothetical protein
LFHRQSAHAPFGQQRRNPLVDIQAPFDDVFVRASGFTELTTLFPQLTLRRIALLSAARILLGVSFRAADVISGSTQQEPVSAIEMCGFTRRAVVPVANFSLNNAT